MHFVFKEGANKGRKFWKCGKGDGSACKFWEWDDEAPRTYSQGSSRDATVGSSHNGSSTHNPGSGNSSDVCFKVRWRYLVKQLLTNLFFSARKADIGPTVCILSLST
jgi:DNA topoisomerase-3